MRSGGKIRKKNKTNIVISFINRLRLNAHREAAGDLDAPANDSLGDFPEERVLAVLQVFFHRLQQKLNFLRAEWKLEGGELLHLCFELVLIWPRRHAPMITSDVIIVFL